MKGCRIVEELEIRGGSVHQNHHSQNEKAIYVMILSKKLEEN
jgi:hypothetical protein